MPKLGLGTVQIGIPYGNQTLSQLMPEKDAHEILLRSIELGIRFFDTASEYGESESRIGSSHIATEYPDVEIVTKFGIPPSELLSDSRALTNWMIHQIEESKKKLGVDSLNLVLFHNRSIEFIRNKNVILATKELLQLRKIKKIGYSIYTPDEARAALETGICSALQIPVNFLDRRFLAPELLKLFETKRIQLIARSLFLQGVLIDHAELPKVQKTPLLKELRNKLTTALGSISLRTAAVSFIQNELPSIFETALIGVQSVEELNETMSWFENTAKTPHDVLTNELFQSALEFCNYHHLYDPSTWNHS